jgi:type IV pilus assembly protein PilB
MIPIKKITSKELGKLLIERGVIKKKQLEKALSVQEEKGGLLGEILVDLGFATEEDIAQALTCQYGFPYLPLKNYEMDQEVIRTVPAQVAVQYCLIPIDKIGKNLTLAMVDPLNVQAIEDIEMITNCSVQTFVSTATDIRKAIDKYYFGKRKE